MQFINEFNNVYFVFCSYVGQCMQCRVIHRVHQTMCLGPTKTKNYMNKGNNKISEIRAILQRESKNS